MAPATKAAKRPTKAPAKAAATTKAASPLENITKLIRKAGKEGIAVKDLATATGVSEATVRKAVKGLEDEGKVRRDGPGIVKAVRGGGRKSEDVSNRDNQVLAAIRKAGKEGLTKKQVVEAVSTTDQLAYESLWRLRLAGSIQREGSTRNATWVATS